jgi:mevalonate kinase
MSVGSAPGKIILFGEHAVVYGRPAIAVPVYDRQATAWVEPASSGSGIILQAQDLGRHYPLTAATADDALALIVRLTLRALEASPRQDLTVTVRSAIPIASGLGSGAAVSAAVVRALAAYFGAEVTPGQVSELVYQTEVLHHGTPSGIDNTVVAFQQPVYYIKGQPPEHFRVGCPFHLLIGDTGVPSPTRVAVAEVRQRWRAERAHYGAVFDAMGQIADEARRTVERGDIAALGPLMDRNQELLREIGVSSLELRQLILAAREAGAWGAKLSGAGRGGNMIALVAPATAGRVADAMRRAGAKEVIATCVGYQL